MQRNFEADKLVPDSALPLHIWQRLCHGDISTSVAVGYPCRAHIVCLPAPHRDRGTVERGGRHYFSDAWLDGETIGLFDADGHELAMFQSAQIRGKRRREVSAVTLTLPIGEIRFVPSSNFLGDFIVSLVEIP